VDDREIHPLIEKTLDRKNPRDWFYALTDYGVMLKTLRPDPNTRSKHYKKQAPFKGSRREVRGKILAHLAENKELTYDTLIGIYGFPEERITAAAESLVNEGLIIREKKTLYLG
jgi:A/G-specific adenine glycosylase